MGKKDVKTIFFIVIFAVLAFFTSFSVDEKTVFAAETSFSVVFSEEYPKLGKDFSVNVEGLEKNETCTYTWKVDETVKSQGKTYRPTEADLEKFITVIVNTTKGRSISKKIYFSKLPVVYIDTNNVPIVDKKNYVKGSMVIQGNDRYHSGNSTLYNGGLEIRGRGNSSWDAPKKPYRLKLSSKADIFGMGASKHWTLLANYYDTSLSRNELSYDFSGELGLVYMDSENVILIMNGTYQGVYQLCEHIRIDKTRIDITDWEKIAEDTAETIMEAEALDEAGDLEDYLVENMSWITAGRFNWNGKTYFLEDYEIELPDIDGGYLLELDKNMDEVSCFYSGKSQPLMFKSPEYVKTNSEMMNYVKNYVNAFEKASASADGYTTYQGSEVHYTELYDMEALAQYFLVTELFFNTDGMKKSTYMYKDNGEPMKMGPIWDMDWCAGNPYEQASPYDRWQTLFYDDEMVRDQWYRAIIKDPYFAYKVKDYYDSYHESIEDFVAEGGKIDANIDYLKEAGKKNDEKWNAKNTGFLENTNKLKVWMNKRIEWLDVQMESIDSLLQSWGTIDGNLNQEIRIESVVQNEKGLVLKISTEYMEEVGIYVNGIKVLEQTPVNQAVEGIISLDKISVDDLQEVFIVVRTMHDGELYMAYETLELQELEPEPTKSVTEIFGDVKQTWYTPYIQYVYDKGLMVGNNGLFRPTQNMTRAQVVSTLYQMEGAPEITDYSACKELKDVKAGEWYTDAICWAYANKLAAGNAATATFGVNEPVKRQQLAVFFYKYAGYKNLQTTQKGDLTSLLNVEKIESYAKEAVEWAVGAGIISGIERTSQSGMITYDLAPRGYASRAQLATILQKFCEMYHL